jgi:hypothetical protein
VGAPAGTSDFFHRPFFNRGGGLRAKPGDDPSMSAAFCSAKWRTTATNSITAARALPRQSTMMASATASAVAGKKSPVGAVLGIC